jgi:hypothetical protein
MLFGLPMNTFESSVWEEHEEEPAEALWRRAIQLRNGEQRRAEVVEEISKKHEDEEAKSQTQGRVQAGTEVMLKARGLLSKLQPRYLGPYTVLGRTKLGNVWLESRDGKRLKSSVPPSQLKTIRVKGNLNMGEQHYEVEGLGQVERLRR